MSELEKVATEALALSPESRAELAEMLIQSLDEEEDGSIRSAWLNEIRRRDEQIRANLAVTKPASQVLREARQQLRWNA